MRHLPYLKLLYILFIAFSSTLMAATDPLSYANDATATPLLDYFPIIVFAETGGAANIFQFISGFAQSFTSGDLWWIGVLAIGTAAVTGTIKAFQKRSAGAGVKEIIFPVVMAILLLAPSESVRIYDGRTASSSDVRIVDHVPWFVAATASVSSIFTARLMNIVDDASAAIGTTTNFNYGAQGLGAPENFALRAIQKIQLDSNVTANINAVVKECIVPNSNDSRMFETINTYKSGDRYDAFGGMLSLATNTEYQHDLNLTQMSNGQNCIDFITTNFAPSVATAYDNNITAVLGNLNFLEIDNMSALAAQYFGMSDHPDVNDSYTQTLSNFTGYIKNYKFEGALAGAIVNARAEAIGGGDNTAIVAQAVANASMGNIQTTGIGNWRALSELVPTAHNYLLIIIYGASALMALVVLASGYEKGMVILKEYFIGLVTFEFIKVAFALANNVMLYYSQDRALDLLSGAAKNDLNPASMPMLGQHLEYLADMAGMAGALGLAAMILIPGIVFGGKVVSAMGVLGNVGGMIQNRGTQGVVEDIAQAKGLQKANQRTNEDAQMRSELEKAGIHISPNSDVGSVYSAYMADMDKSARNLAETSMYRDYDKRYGAVSAQTIQSNAAMIGAGEAAQSYSYDQMKSAGEAVGATNLTSQMAQGQGLIKAGAVDGSGHVNEDFKTAQVANVATQAAQTIAMGHDAAKVSGQKEINDIENTIAGHATNAQKSFDEANKLKDEAHHTKDPAKKSELEEKAKKLEDKGNSELNTANSKISDLEGAVAANGHSGLNAMMQSAIVAGKQQVATARATAGQFGYDGQNGIAKVRNKDTDAENAAQAEIDAHGENIKKLEAQQGGTKPKTSGKPNSRKRGKNGAEDTSHDLGSDDESVETASEKFHKKLGKNKKHTDKPTKLNESHVNPLATAGQHTPDLRSALMPKAHQATLPVDSGHKVSKIQTKNELQNKVGNKKEDYSNPVNNPITEASTAKQASEGLAKQIESEKKAQSQAKERLADIKKEPEFKTASVDEVLKAEANKAAQSRIGSAIGAVQNMEKMPDIYARNAMYGEMSQAQSTLAKINEFGSIKTAVAVDALGATRSAEQTKNDMRAFSDSFGGGADLIKAMSQGGEEASKKIMEAMKGYGSTAYQTAHQGYQGQIGTAKGYTEERAKNGDNYQAKLAESSTKTQAESGMASIKAMQDYKGLSQDAAINSLAHQASRQSYVQTKSTAQDMSMKDKAFGSAGYEDSGMTMARKQSDDAIGATKGTKHELKKRGDKGFQDVAQSGAESQVESGLGAIRGAGGIHSLAWQSGVKAQSDSNALRVSIGEAGGAGGYIGMNALEAVAGTRSTLAAQRLGQKYGGYANLKAFAAEDQMADSIAGASGKLSAGSAVQKLTMDKHGKESLSRPMVTVSGLDAKTTAATSKSNTEMKDFTAKEAEGVVEKVSGTNLKGKNQSKSLGGMSSMQLTDMGAMAISNQAIGNALAMHQEGSKREQAVMELQKAFNEPGGADKDKTLNNFGINKSNFDHGKMSDRDYAGFLGSAEKKIDQREIQMKDANGNIVSGLYRSSFNPNANGGKGEWEVDYKSLDSRQDVKKGKHWDGIIRDEAFHVAKKGLMAANPHMSEQEAEEKASSMVMGYDGGKEIMAGIGTMATAYGYNRFAKGVIASKVTPGGQKVFSIKEGGSAIKSPGGKFYASDENGNGLLDKKANPIEVKKDSLKGGIASSFQRMTNTAYTMKDKLSGSFSKQSISEAGNTSQHNKGEEQNTSPKQSSEHKTPPNVTGSNPSNTHNSTTYPKTAQGDLAKAKDALQATKAMAPLQATQHALLEKAAGNLFEMEATGKISKAESAARFESFKSHLESGKPVDYNSLKDVGMKFSDAKSMGISTTQGANGRESLNLNDSAERVKNSIVLEGEKAVAKAEPLAAKQSRLDEIQSKVNKAFGNTPVSSTLSTIQNDNTPTQAHTQAQTNASERKAFAEDIIKNTPKGDRGAGFDEMIGDIESGKRVSTGQIHSQTHGRYSAKMVENHFGTQPFSGIEKPNAGQHNVDFGNPTAQPHVNSSKMRGGHFSPGKISMPENAIAKGGGVILAAAVADTIAKGNIGKVVDTVAGGLKDLATKVTSGDADGAIDSVANFIVGEKRGKEMQASMKYADNNFQKGNILEGIKGFGAGLKDGAKGLAENLANGTLLVEGVVETAVVSMSNGKSYKENAQVHNNKTISFDDGYKNNGTQSDNTTEPVKASQQQNKQEQGQSHENSSGMGSTSETPIQSNSENNFNQKENKKNSKQNKQNSHKEDSAPSSNNESIKTISTTGENTPDLNNGVVQDLNKDQLKQERAGVKSEKTSPIIDLQNDKDSEKSASTPVDNKTPIILPDLTQDDSEKIVDKLEEQLGVMSKNSETPSQQNANKRASVAGSKLDDDIEKSISSIKTEATNNDQSFEPTLTIKPKVFADSSAITAQTSEAMKPSESTQGTSTLSAPAQSSTPSTAKATEVSAPNETGVASAPISPSSSVAGTTSAPASTTAESAKPSEAAPSQTIANQTVGTAQSSTSTSNAPASSEVIKPNEAQVSAPASTITPSGTTTLGAASTTVNAQNAETARANETAPAQTTVSGAGAQSTITTSGEVKAAEVKATEVKPSDSASATVQGASIGAAAAQTVTAQTSEAMKPSESTQGTSTLSAPAQSSTPSTAKATEVSAPNETGVASAPISPSSSVAGTTSAPASTTAESAKPSEAAPSQTIANQTVGTAQSSTSTSNAPASSEVIKPNEISMPSVPSSIEIPVKVTAKPMISESMDQNALSSSMSSQGNRINPTTISGHDNTTPNHHRNDMESIRPINEPMVARQQYQDQSNRAAYIEETRQTGTYPHIQSAIRENPVHPAMEATHGQKSGQETFAASVSARNEQDIKNNATPMTAIDIQQAHQTRQLAQVQADNIRDVSRGMGDMVESLEGLGENLEKFLDKVEGKTDEKA
jgi:hypothetical protein